LLNESTRRLKVSAKKLGSSIEKSRPYHEAVEKARIAQIECQKAAMKFQRANGERSELFNECNNYQLVNYSRNSRSC
jgi:SH3 domain-binding protein 5 (SH3BP5)